ncbi:sensor histidine kinase [Catenuloplanes atrovinosus]|uniref:histidine kinase n=1 Tax=Catenuloplanes atrovinosus TaxID=137266 RepID=A0AAE3YMM5_9ACTN|nr:ATP-binding protein [Catenuloplanes atrovinosus]MDR7275131.1 signal transduction histidine kinase [Catenuloplanes atrovinosus]
MGNALLGAVSTVLWPAVEPRLFFEIAVDDWPTALVLGPAQATIFTVATVLVAPRLARVHARLCHAVLAPTTRQQVHRARLDLLDAHAAELRRIERDLHDGTQARLVAIAMRLAVSRRVLDGVGEGDTVLVRKLLAEAHDATEGAMTELRTVIHGVYPPVLAEHGLKGALTGAAAHCPLPVTLDVPDTTAVPAAVEALAYFAVVEALTNAARHGHAQRAEVRVRHDGRTLTATVTDDGTGGADPHRGTGLTGLARRAEALDGTLRVHSPPGGPTTVTVEVPCES